MVGSLMVGSSSARLACNQERRVNKMGMPTPHHLKNLAVPGNRYTLKEAGAQGLMLSLACAHCRKPPVLFLASDLIKVLPPSLDCFQPPPFACSTCGTDRYIAVTLRAQEAAAVGKVVVR